jgi:hypothetical protein
MKPSEYKTLQARTFKHDGARLLGRDLAAIAKPETVQSILGILERETSDPSKYQLAIEMGSSRIGEAELFDQNLRLLQKLNQGVSEVIKGGYSVS